MFHQGNRRREILGTLYVRAPSAYHCSADPLWSAAGTQQRPGFQELVAEVGLGHVGLVLGLDISRLARSCKEWYHLLEICALFDTLISDQDGLYNPADYNDRLLLGLKGTMSEAEVHTLRQRMEQGRLSKARRGELFNFVPMG